MASLREALRQDYERYGSLRNLALWTMGVHRFGNWSQNIKPKPLRSAASKLYGAMFFGVELCTNNTLNREVELGDDFHLIHSGNVRIHPAVVIGDRVGVMNDVTIGTNMDRPGVPVIGNDVFIGAGARILGAVNVGDGARIAANSLVVSDVPAGATAIGVPARVMRYTGRQSKAASTNNDERGAA